MSGELPQKWWGSRRIADGEALWLQVGTASLWLGRRDPMLVLATAFGTDPLGEDHQVQVGLSADEVPEGHAVSRFVIPSGATTLSLMPRLADRPVIARPETDFLLPPRAEVRTFVSTPLWVAIAMGHALTELPLYRPSDTWFGATPLDGELCYAVKTALRVRLAELPRRPHRAITPLHLHNDSSEPLQLQRVRLPVPHLRVLAAADGSLWTEGVEMVRSSGDEASVRVLPGTPPEAGAVEPAGEQRIEASGLLPVLRAFNSFLS